MTGSISDGTGRIIESARKRKIRVIAVAPISTSEDAEISLSVWDLERFLDLVAPSPLTDDGLAGRIIGRGQDMGVEEEPWRYELLPGHSGTAFEFHAIVTIPADDIEEVIVGLEDVSDESGRRACG